MDKIKVAIVGYGNVGKYALEAVQAAGDMDLVGIVRDPNIKSAIPSELKSIKVVSDIKKLSKVDVAILSLPTRIIPEMAKDILELGINTVDSYDIHGKLYDYKLDLDKVAKANNVTSIISAGWDPGTDSIIRAIMLAMTPKGITYTNFGPGMSMGHTVVAEDIEGVEKALSMTIPAGTGVHRRIVYVEVKEGFDFENISNKIKKDSYFINDETVVKRVDDVDNLIDKGHGVTIDRKGVSGNTHNQSLSYTMKANNPAITSQILVSAARAVTKQSSGAYTLLEIPIIDLLAGDKEQLLRELV